MYWRDAKLRELGQQQLPAASSRNIVLVPVPAIAAPSAEQLFAGPLQACLDPSPASIRLAGLVGIVPGAVDLAVKPDGLLFYVAAGVVESGQSVLAGWVPVEGGACSQLVELCRASSAMDL